MPAEMPIGAICYNAIGLERHPGGAIAVPSTEIGESGLTKGQARKLNALRKSIGKEIADRAFLEWLTSQPPAGAVPDESATMIVDTLWPLVQQGTLAIPRGGYLIRRGRGRIIVEPAKR